MALLLKNENILLLQIPGTASSALEQAVTALPGGVSIGPKHATVAELRAGGMLDGLERPPADIACVVRNHFDLLHAEWYRSRTRWVMELDDPQTVGGWPLQKRQEIKMCCIKDFSDYIIWFFAQRNTEGRQFRLYANYTTQATRVFRAEDLPALTNWLSERTGQTVALPRYNMTKKTTPYWMDYTREARDLVTRLYREELELFGYAF